MERKTFIDNDGFYIDGINGKVWSDIRGRFRGMAIDRLAAYEDTGLEPQTISEILDSVSEWYDAHKEGRLLVLPCKVGDTVWSAGPFVDGKIRAGNVVEINVDSLGFCGFWASFCLEAVVAEFIKDDFGKTVFRTREEAEAKLKEFGK